MCLRFANITLTSGKCWSQLTNQESFAPTGKVIVHTGEDHGALNRNWINLNWIQMITKLSQYCYTLLKFGDLIKS